MTADSPRWKSISTFSFVLTFLSILGVMITIQKGQGWFPIVDWANLAFHEAGHIIFGIFGETLNLYGGTLGQLVFPMVVAISFWKKREWLGVVIGSLWFFENFFNIARYMADARAQLLPLVGSGDHDWTNIFTRWDVLPSDTKIASFVVALGWLGILGTWAWLTSQWYRSK